MSKTVNVKKVNTILDMQLSLWEEKPRENTCYIKVIYLDGRREVHRVGSIEWDAISRDMNIWSAEFVQNEQC